MERKSQSHLKFKSNKKGLFQRTFLYAFGPLLHFDVFAHIETNVLETIKQHALDTNARK